MADLSYNGIVFSLVKTNVYHMEPVLTEDQTQYLYTRVVLDVTGILNPAAMAYLGTAPPIPSIGTLPPQTLVSIRNVLMQPQGQLSWTFALPGGGTFNVLSSPEQGMPCDLNSGPIPLYCDIREIAGSKTAVIRYAIQTFIKECPGGSEDPSQPLLANRFTQELSTDDQHLDTITTTGIAYFRTDFLQAAQRSPDYYRDVIFGALPIIAGMYRERVHVQVAPAQNALRYTVTDRERMYDLGDTTQGDGASFATKVDAEFGVVTLAGKEGIPGGSMLGHCNVRVWGDKRASNWILTQRAFQIIANKMPIGAGADIGFVQQIQMTQSLTDRSIGVNVMYRYNPAKDAIAGFSNAVLDSLRLDTVIGPWDGINPSLPWGKGTRGTSAAVAAFIQTIQDACAGVSSDAEPDQEPYSENSDYTGSPAVSVEPVDVIPSYGTSYSPGQATYTDGKQEIKYHRHSGMIGCPFSGPATGTNGSQSSGGSGSTGSTSTNGMTIPVGGAGSVTPTAVFFQVAQPMSTIVVSFEAECVGQPPSIPDPNNGDSNLVLMTHALALTSPPVAPDGQSPVFRAIGEYTYMQKSAYGLSDQLALGILPWTSYQWANAYLNPTTDYQHGLADDPNSTGGPTVLGANA